MDERLLRFTVGNVDSIRSFRDDMYGCEMRPMYLRNTVEYKNRMVALDWAPMTHCDSGTSKQNG